MYDWDELRENKVEIYEVMKSDKWINIIKSLQIETKCGD